MSDTNEQVLDDGPVLTPLAMWERAQGGNWKPTTEERREILKWLDTEGHKNDKGYRTSYSSYELSEKLGVSATQIRKDRDVIRKASLDAISPEHALDYAGQFLREHELLIKRAEDGLAECVTGSVAQIHFLRLISDLHKRRMSLLQEVSVVPKELGNLNVVEEIWEAEVSRDGITTVHQVALPKGDDEESTDDEA